MYEESPAKKRIMLLWAVNGILAIYTGLYARKNGYGKLVHVRHPDYRGPSDTE